MTYNLEKMKRIIAIVLKRLLERDYFLLQYDVNERSITHKLAEYLQDEFEDYSVDCEYNRLENLVKKIKQPKNGVYWDDIEAKTIYPDIVVHKRGEKDNLLVIELKKSTNRVDRKIDEDKLEVLTSSPEYNYKYGLFLELNIENKVFSKKWFEKRHIKK